MQKINLELFMAQTEEGMYENKHSEYFEKLQEVREEHQKEIREKLNNRVFAGTKNEIDVQVEKFEKEITNEYNEKFLLISQELKSNYNNANDEFFKELKFQLELTNEELIFFKELLFFRLNDFTGQKAKQVIAIQEFMFYKQLLIDGNLKIITNEQK